MASLQKHILILGAGITGLSTALSLLTSPTTKNHKITILASHVPGDLSPEYTSPWAGGHWRSHVGLSDSDAENRTWDEKTYKTWTRWLKEGDGLGGQGETMEEREKRMGLGFRTCHYFWGKDGEETKGLDGSGIWFRDVVKDFGILDLETGTEGGVPKGAIMGMRYKSVCFDPPRHLEYLFERVKGLGARLVKTRVDTSSGLEGGVKDAKRQAGVEGIDIFAFINCSGLSARHFLPPEEEGKLFPVRGQTILVKGEAEKMMTYVGIPGNPDEEMLYVVPRPGSGTAILGGCKQINNFSTEVDEELNRRIIEGVKKHKLCEELRDKETGEFEILSYQVGFRPGRKGGARVEVERDGGVGEGKVDGTWVVHSYGHAGAGYQGSVGCAERVVELVASLDGESV
ncbi:related to D-amino-acid oxidase [Phialocephala subalpina]|uniref:Related to D-amino-acid oxidase n=1 Tax=Phialocephala subalpina TaxID=576137 RepID=A0A1L7XPE6_9HELO|nr:related to D-amino-acid oxidase [Phialocephala subalpina]